MTIHYDGILEYGTFTLSDFNTCLPKLNRECHVCGETLYRYSEKYPEQCLNEDCSECI